LSHYQQNIVSRCVSPSSFTGYPSMIFLQNHLRDTEACITTISSSRVVFNRAWLVTQVSLKLQNQPISHIPAMMQKRPSLLLWPELNCQFMHPLTTVGANFPCQHKWHAYFQHRLPMNLFSIWEHFSQTPLNMHGIQSHPLNSCIGVNDAIVANVTTLTTVPDKSRCLFQSLDHQVLTLG
jgi:hypothetical protein